MDKKDIYMLSTLLLFLFFNLYLIFYFIGREKYDSNGDYLCNITNVDIVTFEDYPDYTELRVTCDLIPINRDEFETGYFSIGTHRWSISKIYEDRYSLYSLHVVWFDKTFETFRRYNIYSLENYLCLTLFIVIFLILGMVTVTWIYEDVKNYLFPYQRLNNHEHEL